MKRFMVVAAIPLLLAAYGLTGSPGAVILAATALLVLFVAQAVTRRAITPMRQFLHMTLATAIMVAVWLLALRVR